MDTKLSRIPYIFFDLQIHSNFVQNLDNFQIAVQNDMAKQLSSLTLPLLIATTCLIVIVRKPVKDNSFSKLPGPKGIWPLGVALNLLSQRERLNVMTSWAHKYKPCCAYKIGPVKIVLLTSASSAKKLLSSTDPGHLNKATFYKVFTPIWRDGIGLSDVEKWKERRRLLDGAFSFRSFMGYTSVFNKQSRMLVKELSELFGDKDANGRHGKSIYEILKQCTLRVICESTMGTDIWGVEGSEKISHALNKNDELCSKRIMQPWLLNDWLWRLHPDSKVLKEVGNMFDQFTYRVIERRKQSILAKKLSNSNNEKSCSNVEGPGMKKMFTSIIEEMILAGIDDEGLVEEVNTFIAAGYESTSTTLQFLLLRLALHPNHQEICREEVDRVFDYVSLCPDGDFLQQSLSQLKYLERCLLETLRMYPTAYQYYRILESPLQLDDNTTIPIGTNVGIYAPGIHFDPDYYPNPEVFDPDRFLPDNVKTRGQYAFLPFSAGPRNCIGYKFGLNELKVLTARLLRHFKIETSDALNSVPLNRVRSFDSNPFESCTI